jgi:hypothetical protein
VVSEVMSLFRPNSPVIICKTGHTLSSAMGAQRSVLKPTAVQEDKNSGSSDRGMNRIGTGGDISESPGFTRMSLHKMIVMPPIKNDRSACNWACDSTGDDGLWKLSSL